MAQARADKSARQSTAAATREQELTRAAQQGDRKALDRLIRDHESQVLRFGRRMCGNPDDAEDVLQDTFLAMTRYLKDFEGKASLSTWLYSIARSFCIKRRRRSKYAPKRVESLHDAESGAPISVPDPTRGPDDAVAGAQVQQMLDQAIGELRPMYREVLVLRDVEGLTAPEVGEVLGITVQAVKSRLHRAREQVRAALAPVLEPGLPHSPSGAGCQHTAALFSQHLEGDIDAETCAQMERHVTECAHCGAVCHGLRETLAACRQVGRKSPEVPPELQRAVRQAVRSYVDALE